ncbi:hypothetical protein JXB11_01410 [Candidatus Woesearchaeota archaeon]|nr:hypothetical protein [Candidatus Woesearchaeota archaeon]
MAVADIQKINSLAQEMLRNNIVATSEEAFAKAESILNKTADVKPLEENETIIQLQKNIRSLQFALNDAIKELAETKKKMEGLSYDIKELQKRPKAPAPEVQTTISEPVKEEPKKQTIKGQTFSQEDVSIEKVFYSGKK